MTEVVKVGPGETVSNRSVSLVIRHVRITVKLVFCVFQSQQFLAAQLLNEPRWFHSKSGDNAGPYERSEFTANTAVQTMEQSLLKISGLAEFKPMN